MVGCGEGLVGDGDYGMCDVFDVLWVVESAWCRAVRVVSCRSPDADNPLQTDRDTCSAVPLLGERVA